MMRVRSAGNFSSEKFSPRQNSVGGVDRSTSSTNPGRGMDGLSVPRPRGPSLDGLQSCSAFSHVEGDLDGAATAGGRGVGDGVDVIVERVRGREQSFGLV